MGNIEIARTTFEHIAEKFPGLVTSIREGRNVDLVMEIPEQKRLSFRLELYMDNLDELHLQAGTCFWLEWFPCSDPERVEQFLDAVSGLITGKYRIIEHYRGTRAVKAELQASDDDGWKTIGTWATFDFPIPWKKERRIISNTGTAP